MDLASTSRLLTNIFANERGLGRVPICPANHPGFSLCISYGDRQILTVQQLQRGSVICSVNTAEREGWGPWSASVHRL